MIGIPTRRGAAALLGVAALVIASVSSAASASRGAGPASEARTNATVSSASILAAVGAYSAGRLPALPAELAPPPMRQTDNVGYDGRFTFVRIRFTPASGSSGWGNRCFGGGAYGEPSWAHDYPRAERNLMRILSETTFLDPYLGGGNILWTNDEELFRYPLAYISEPGCWTMEDDEVQGLRDYLEKGGFLILDDFRGRDWANLDVQMRRVMPDAQWVELDARAEIFQSFFEIDERVLRSGGRGWSWPTYMGIYEDNDPSKRLMVIANYNNDIGDYWEWADEGFLPIDLTNDAYKLGVNYIVYAMTH
jgi:hypothetical protein